jgi:cytochrome c-type biogenesis protein CcmH/NrfG
MGRAWAELADYAEAGRWFQRALALDPELHVARCRLAMLLLECGDPEQAARICRDVLQQEPACVEAHVALARALLEQGEVDAAVASQKEAIRLRPEGAGLHAGLGDILSSGGDLDAAVAAHRQAIALNPRCVPARAGLATILRGKTNDDDLMQIEQLLQAPWMTDKQRAALHFALAQARDGRGDYARAAEHMLTANALMRQHYREREQDYNPAEYQQYIDRLIAAFTPAYFERVRGWGRDSERPVFIVGMPRSGTTLAEQILASHPRVHGAGERRFAFLGFNALPAAVGRDAPPAECLDGLTPAIVQRLADWHLQQLHGLDQGRSSRVVDKMPDNFSLLGWIVTLFPRARIIHCQRDVRDVALSCWITNFARIRWANDLEHLASRINEYRRIIAHYHRVLPVPIFPLDYEQMVADQEATTRRLLDFVGLDWDPACLHFHQTERLVRTASVAQVRQPIYQRSVARWKRYETMLRPLLDRLQLSQESGAGEPGGER